MKLIRDKLAWHLRKGDRVRIARDRDEYERLLLKKFNEEFGEVFAEVAKKLPHPDKVIDELADLLEVMEYLADIYGSACLETIIEAKKAKRAHRGGFDGGIVLLEDGDE